MFARLKTYSRGALLLAALAAPAAAWSQVVTAGQLSSTAVDVTKPAASPLVALHIRGNASRIQIQYVGPSGESFYQAYEGAFTGTVELQGYMASNGFSSPTVFSLYTEPGSWSLAALSVCGSAFPCPTYSGAKLAALFNTLAITVTNPNAPDITPPKALAAGFSESSFSASSGTIPTAMMRVSDDVSGVAAVTIVAQNASAPEDQIYFSSNTPTRPVTAGVLALTGYASTTSLSAGTYNVTSVGLSDNAGNSVYISDPAKISQIFRGASSIKVTK